MLASGGIRRSAITDPGSYKGTWSSGSLVALSVRAELEARQTPTIKVCLTKFKKFK